MSERNIGWVSLQVIPTVKGIRNALTTQIAPDVTSAGRSSGEAFGKSLAEGAAPSGKTAGAGFMAQFKGEVGRQFSTGQMAATFAGGFAASKAIDWVKGAIGGASDLRESISKSSVVFSENAQQVEQWSERSTKAMGLTQQKAVETAATYGSMLQALGLDQEESQKLAERAVQHAADLASFSNTSVDQALEAIRSAFSGESEPAKFYGSVLLDTRVQQQALNDKLWDGVGALSTSARAQATFNLLLKDTSSAIGDYARTATGAANTSRTLAAQGEQLQTTFGEGVFDGFGSVSESGQALTDTFENMTPTVHRLGAAFGSELGTIAQAAALIGSVTAAVDSLDSALPEGGNDVLGTAFSVGTNPIMGSLSLITDNIGRVEDNWNRSWGNITRSWNQAGKNVAPLVDAVGGAVDSVLGDFDRLTGGIQSRSTGLMGWINGTGQVVGDWLDKPSQALVSAREWIQDHSDWLLPDAPKIPDVTSGLNLDGLNNKLAVMDDLGKSTAVADQIRGIGGAAADTRTRVQQLGDAIDELNGDNRSLLDSQAAWEDRFNQLATMGDTKTTKARTWKDKHGKSHHVDSVTTQLPFDPAVSGGRFDLSTDSGNQGAQWLTGAAGDLDTVVKALFEKGDASGALSMWRSGRRRIADQLGDWQVDPRKYVKQAERSYSAVERRLTAPVPSSAPTSSQTTFEFSGPLVVQSQADAARLAAERTRLQRSSHGQIPIQAAS